MRRYELADEQWELIADLFPPEQGNGHPWRSHRLMVNAMLWILNAGYALAEFARSFCPLADGLQPLQPLAEKMGRSTPISGAAANASRRRRPPRLGSVVGRRQRTCVRAPRRPARGEKGGRKSRKTTLLGRSRGGFGTKSTWLLTATELR